MTDTKSPQLSVVIPSVNGWTDLEGAISALIAQDGLALEIIVPERCAGDLRQNLAATFPEVVMIPVSKATTIPEMRALAFAQARGPAVAVIEDHVVVPPGWAKALLSELASSDGVVAGSVANAATKTLMDRAAFLCEYSHCMPPIPSGAVDWLTGNNVVYRQDLLERYQSVYQSGGWENRLHDAFKADGLRLLCQPEIVVGHKKHYSFLEYMSQRYLYARSYAGARLEGASILKRLIYGGAAFILPFLLFYRIVSRVWTKGYERGTLILSLPLLFLFVCAWGWGEVIGYWFGAGDSLAKVC